MEFGNREISEILKAVETLKEAFLKIDAETKEYICEWQMDSLPTTISEERNPAMDDRPLTVTHLKTKIKIKECDNAVEKLFETCNKAKKRVESLYME